MNFVYLRAAELPAGLVEAAWFLSTRFGSSRWGDERWGDEIVEGG